MLTKTGVPNMTFRERIQNLITETQAKVLELEAEWDRLDSMGTQTEEQRKITDRMVKLANEITGFQNLLKTLKGTKK